MQDEVGAEERNDTKEENLCSQRRRGNKTLYEAKCELQFYILKKPKLYMKY